VLQTDDGNPKKSVVKAKICVTREDSYGTKSSKNVVIFAETDDDK
jgi:hypothetical protein